MSFRSRATTTNTFFSINSIYLMIRRTLTVVYNLYLSLQLWKLILILLKVKKSILKVIFILILANKKVSLKKQNFLSLLSIKKKAIIIPKFSSLLLLIFWAPTLVLQMRKSSFFTKLSCIIVISLSKSMRVLTKNSLNLNEY